MGIVSLAVGYLYWRHDPLSNWQTIIFTTLTGSQMTLALACRSERDSLFQIGLLTNPSMLGAVTLTFLLQLAVIYVPWLQAIFKTSSLTWTELMVCLVLSTVVFWAFEFRKWIVRRSVHA
jgi:Ca2+-transporting ATPase